MKNNKKKLKAPKLRFPEFTDDWEECELGKFGKTFTGLSGKTKDDFGHGEAKFVTYLNVFNNSISDPNGTESIEIDDKQNQVKYGDIFFTTSSETAEEVGMSSIWLDNSKNIYLNSFCFGYSPTVEFDPYYLAFMLRSPSIRKKFIFLAQGISRYNISKIKVMKMKIPVTSLIEQKKIGKFFKEIDQLITLNQNKISHIKDLKAGLLQKMFPKNGETKPEIRFDGFTDDWEEFTFNEFTEYESSNYSARQFKGCNLSGKYKVFDANKEIACINEFDQPKEYISIIKDGAGIGRTEIRPAKSSIIGTMGYIKSTNSDLYFVYFLMKNIRWDNYQNGSTIPHIYYKDYGNEKFFIPKIEEQQKIGEFFSQLDNLLTLYQRKLEHLQEQKKSLLKQMFI